jgi:hypothetical protein
VQRKSYLLVYDTPWTHEMVKEWVRPLVYTWRYSMANSFYLVSDKSAEEIAAGLRKASGESGRFLVLEFTENSQGMLLKQDWHVLQRKELLRDEKK